MKSTTLFILTLAVLSMSVSSCKKDNPVTPPDTSATLSASPDERTVNFPASGGFTDYVITTDQVSWSFSSTRTWCDVFTLAQDDSVLRISADPHTSLTAPLEAKVTITAGDATPIEITVTQDAYVPPVTTSKSIYVAGQEMIGDNNYSMLWKYQDATVTRQQLSTKAFSSANSVFLNGTDVYVGGHDYHETGKSPDWGTATVWENGTAVVQEKPAGSVNLSRVNSVVTVNNKVYAAGYYSPTFDNPRACVWVDGVLNTALLNETERTEAKFIGISTDGKVHVLGCKYETVDGIEYEILRYWVDGVAQTGYPTNRIYPTGLWVEGNDVHIIGHAPAGGNQVNISYYWKNGVMQTLQDASEGSYVLLDIYLLSGDVYISGKRFWKNGTQISSPISNYMYNFVVSEDGTFYTALNVSGVPTLYVDSVPVVLTTDGAKGVVNDMWIVE